MSPEERAEQKKREIEEEFLRYKMARKLREKQQVDEYFSWFKDKPIEAWILKDPEAGGIESETASDVKSMMEKFKNIEGAPKQIEGRLDELEALRIEAKNLRQRFEVFYLHFYRCVAFIYLLFFYFLIIKNKFDSKRMPMDLK